MNSAKTCLDHINESTILIANGTKLPKPPAPYANFLYPAWLQQIKVTCPLYNSKAIHRPININPTLETKIRLHQDLTPEETRMYVDYQNQFQKHQYAASKQITALEESLSQQWLTLTKIANLRTSDTLANDRVNGIINAVVEVMQNQVTRILDQIQRDVATLPPATTKEDLLIIIEIIECLSSRFLIICQTHGLHGRMDLAEKIFAQNLKSLCAIDNSQINLQISQSEEQFGILSLTTMIDLINSQLNLMNNSATYVQPISYQPAITFSTLQSKTRFSSNVTELGPNMIVGGVSVPTVGALHQSASPIQDEALTILKFIQRELGQLDSRMIRLESNSNSSNRRERSSSRDKAQFPPLPPRDYIPPPPRDRSRSREKSPGHYNPPPTDPSKQRRNPPNTSTSPPERFLRSGTPYSGTSTNQRQDRGRSQQQNFSGRSRSRE